MYLGMDIFFQRVDSLVYDVYFVGYRNCSGITFQITAPDVHVMNNDGSNNKQLTPTRVSISDISPICKKQGSYCAPVNTYGTGDGVEQHVYKCRVDFTSSPFDTLLQSGKPIIAYYGWCCRPNEITNGAAKEKVFNYAWIDLSHGDVESPVFLNKPSFYPKANQASYCSPGLKNAMYDSVSFELAPLYSAFQKTITTGSPPVKVYNPTNGSPKPNANPPTGFYFNSKTGDMVFTPVNGGDVGQLAMECTFWKRDSNNTLIPVSMSRREQTFKVQTVTGQPIVLPTPQDYKVCEGDQLCFNINPVKSGNDSLFVSVISSPDGSDISIVDTSSKQKLNFCWTPKAGTARIQPYLLTVETRDTSCPRITISSRTYSIYVLPAVNAELKFKDQGCNTMAVEVISDSNSEGYTQIWSVYDETSGKLVSSNEEVMFQSNAKPNSSLIKDTLFFRKKGDYSIVLNAKSLNGCAVNIPVKVSYNNDIPELFSSRKLKCKGVDLLIKQDLYSDSVFKSYQWSDGVTGINYSFTDSTQFNNLFLKANFKSNICYAIDLVELDFAENPKLQIPDDFEACTIDSLLEATVVNSYSFSPETTRWNSSVTSSIQANSGGWYYAEARNGCGSTLDSLFILELKKPQIEIGRRDTIICDGQPLVLGINSKNPHISDQILWSDKTTTDTTVFTTLGLKTVEVTNACGTSRDTVFIRKNLKKPVLTLPKNVVVCDGNPVIVDASWDESTYHWNDGSSDETLSVTKAGNYAVVAQNSCGSDSASVSVTSISTPEIQFGDTFYCAGSSVNLMASNQPDDYIFWSTGDTSRFLNFSFSGNFSLIVSNSCGKDSVDFTVSEKKRPMVNLGADTTINSNLTLDAGPGNSYVWNTGDTNRFLTATKSGLYKVEVFNECGSDIDSIRITNTDIEKIPVFNYSIYPNPNHGTFVLKLHHSEKIKSAVCYAMNGIKVQTEIGSIEKDELKISLINAVSGVYYFTVVTESGTRTTKLLIQ